MNVKNQTHCADLLFGKKGGLICNVKICFLLLSFYMQGKKEGWF